MRIRLQSDEYQRHVWLLPVIASLAMVLIVAVGALVIAAVAKRQMNLNDGSVWVYSQQHGAAVRLNIPSQEPTARIYVDETGIDLHQHDSFTALSYNSQIVTVDEATVETANPVILPDDSTVHTGGGSVAFLHTRTGTVWVASEESSADNAVFPETPRMELGEGGMISVSHDGAIWGYRPQDGMVLKLESASDQSAKAVYSLTADVPVQADSFTVVGEEPVMLSGHRLYTRAGSVDVAVLGTPIALQSSPHDDVQQGWLAVVGPGRLAIVDLNSLNNVPVVLDSNDIGEPAIPVSLNGCVYAAWKQQNDNYLSVCSPSANSDTAVFRSLQHVDASSDLMFRVNHGYVALNDVTDGTSWTPTHSMTPVDIRWNDIAGQDGSKEQDTQQSTADAYNALTDCVADTVPVIANDDDFVVRRGRIQILDVLHNDIQSDCSVLRIERIGRIQTSGLSTLPESQSTVDVALVHNGRFLQIDASNASDGDMRFSYEISNGLGQTAQAYVNIHIRSDGNQAPAPYSVPIEYQVERNGIIQFNALEGFFDPDSDAMMLTKASIIGETPAQLVMRPDGLITFMSNDAPNGRVDVELSVSDGMATCTDSIYILVKEDGTLPAQLEPVAVTASMMTPITIDMKKHIQGTGANVPRISDVQANGNANVSVIKNGLGVRFETDIPGIHYLSYSVLQGSISSTGRIRVDVRVSLENNAKPLAVNDVAVLDDSGQAIVAPLLNDIDPTGGIPAITGVTDPNGNISYAIVDNRVRLIAREIPETPTTLTYTIANRSGSDAGTITVLPNTVHQASDNAMHAPDLEVQVRTEGLVSAEVLDYATGGNGRILHLESIRPINSATFQGLAFMSGDTIRYQANATSGRYALLYTVCDDLGNIASGTISVSVHQSNAEHKAKPTPNDIDTQAKAGHHIRIPIDMTGIDVDGDDVQLLGLGNTAPTLGRITTVGADYMLYEAYSDSEGTDTFTYAVEDWTGQRAQGTIRVAVFRNSEDFGILARNDEITLRPSVTATVQVTGNDFSADAAGLVLDGRVESADIPNVQVTDNGSITLTAPGEAGTYHTVYTVRNAAGLSASAVLSVIVDPNAPIAAPIAYDYQVPPSETVDKRTVTVDMSPWVFNPSGDQSALSISVHPSAAERARISEDQAMAISIDLTDRSSFIPYVVTDTVHGLTATAFIQVPAYGVFPPMLRPKAPQLSVEAGDTLEININDHIRVGAGKQPVIDSLSVSATKASNTDFVKDSQTLVFTAQSDYAGPASLTLTVSDGVHSEETTLVNTAPLTLSITVLGRQTAPPTFSDTVVDVMPGEKPTVLDASKLAHSSDDSDLLFSGGGSQNGISVIVQSDGLVTVQAAVDAIAGESAHFPIAIEYSQGVVHAGISVRVIASNRPLADLSVAAVTIAAGSSQRVDVFHNAFNPFPESSLTLADCAVEHAAVTVSCASDGMVSVTVPENTAFGTYTVHLVVDDATASADRRVTESFDVTIISIPEAPRLLEHDCQAGNGLVELRWVAGASNGSPITDFEVSWSGPDTGLQSCGLQTACTVEGLRNGKQYRFIVRAINAVGVSPDSNAVSLTPDQLPSAPTNVTVQPGYETVTVQWHTPQGEFSEVLEYSVTLNGLPSGSIVKEISSATSSTSFAISRGQIHDGLAVSATVTARNAVGYGAQSTPSASAYPWSKPDEPSVQAHQSEYNGDAVIVSGALSDLRNTTCADITLHFGSRSETVPCSTPSHAFELTSDDYFTDLSTSITMTTKETGSITASGGSVHPTYEPTPPSHVSVIPADDHCVVSWNPTGKYHDAFIVRAHGTKYTVESTSYHYEIPPWSACGTVSVQQTFKQRISKAASASNDDLANKQPATISLSLYWADRNTVNAIIRNILHGQSATLVITIQHGDEITHVARIPASQTTATFDMSQFEQDGVFTWSAHLENGAPELIDSIHSQGIVTSSHMDQRPEALVSKQGLAQATGLIHHPHTQPRNDHADSQ